MFDTRPRSPYFFTVKIKKEPKIVSLIIICNNLDSTYLVSTIMEPVFFGRSRYRSGKRVDCQLNAGKLSG
jgi:hypothetical protein